MPPKSVEKLPDPFLAKCLACQHEAYYPKSGIEMMVSTGSS
jgi:hypothetical protein